MRLHQTLGQPAPGQTCAYQRQRCLVAVRAPELARKHKAWISLLRVAAGHQHLARGGQLLHRELRPCGAARPMLGQRLLPELELRRHHGHQRLAAHFLEALAPVHGGPLEHQGQMGAARMQKLQRICLWSCQHLNRQRGKLVHQPVQRFAPVRGQQFGGDGQRQPFLQPGMQRLSLPVQQLQLLGQQARLRLEAMLTAEGTRPSLRAAAEKEPASSTARNSGTWSALKGMVSICQKN